jgi:FtsP/CotA-like multicopper oxidase with cupredoxin domain
VVGVEVGTGARTRLAAHTATAAPATAAPATADAASRRRLRLVAWDHRSDSAGRPAFGYALLRPGDAESPPARGRRLGPLITLTRGEPVGITVVNRLAEPTSVHWHGIELESYFDGVAGFSGGGTRLAPVIAPADSFEARFTPPRAGTFIYHTHVDEPRQMRAGLVGALLVLEPGERHDPERDRVLVVTSPWGGRQAPVLIDGSATPPPMELRVGARYRLRFVNITVGRPGLVMALVAQDTLAAWRLLAKDGADLARDRATLRRARQPVSIGETVDVELVPRTAGELRLEARTATDSVLAVMSVRVR